MNNEPHLAAAGYAPGVPREVDIPAITVLGLLDEAAHDYGDRPALDFMGAVTSYRQLREQVNAAASVLLSHGVREGDRVAVVLPTCPQTVVAFYAIMQVGAIAVEHNPLSAPEEYLRTFTDHGARVAIVWDKLADDLAALDLPQPLQLLTVDMSRALPRLKRLALRLPVPTARETRKAMTQHTEHGISWDDEVRAARHAPATPVATRTPDDIALLQYTGGTTGDPKAAMLTHRNLVANVTQSRAWVPELHEGEETFYGILPLFHAYGMMLCLLCAVRLGACLVLFPRFDRDQVIATMKRRPATFLPGVPPIYAALADAADKGEVDLSSIKVGLSGAMPLPAELIERWEKHTGGFLIEGYGMTETSPIALGNPVSPLRRAGSVGLPFPSTEIKVIDPEDPSVERGIGEPGELLIRGPQVFTGYWNKPEQSATLLDEEGWIHTGDVVVVDETGFVTIVDRIKEVILTGGFNVYPSEVEDALRTHPAIEDAAVVGLPGRAGSEDVVAAIIVSGAEPDPEELRSHLRGQLAGYKVPRRFVRVEELPASAIGKTLRRMVRESLLEQPDQAVVDQQPVTPR